MNELLLRRRLMLAAKGNTPINYLKFIALTDNGIIGLANRSSYQTVLEYSFDEEAWVDFNTGTTVTLVNSGDTVYVRGKLTGNNDTSNYTQFKTTSGKFNVSGNINSLWNYEDLEQALYIRCGYDLFNACDGLVNASELTLGTSATTLADSCYRSMFNGCTSLTTAPELPATTLADSCYRSMFNGCTSLTTAPALPATTLASRCYGSMFYGCTSLTEIPSGLLPATELAIECYNYMFSSCTSLTAAPELPATALTSACYNGMFSYCTSLTTAPALPATELAGACYSLMFRGCNSLTTAPELPATTLAVSCYGSMFNGCTSLTTAPVLPATALTSGCYGGMFQGCSKLNYIKCLAVNGIKQNSSTNNWVQGVAPTGTFIEHPDAVGLWPINSVDGIPTGWRVVNSECITFTAHENNSALGLANRSTNQTVFEYSTGGTVWEDFNTGVTVDLNSGDTVYVRGKLTESNDDSNYTQFETTSGTFSVSGNINSLWNYDNLEQALYGCCGYGLFSGCAGLISADELVLPATALAQTCYSGMFNGCTSLVEAPDLPATALTNTCYYSMFRDCSSLTKASELPATILASSCYQSMFEGCTGLTIAPELPATALTNYCYYEMFNDCTNLNYIKCLAVDGINQNYSTYNWVRDVAPSGKFIKNTDVSEDTWGRGSNGIPDGWTVE